MTQKTGTKAYWEVLNKLLNKSNIPIIPPVLFNNKFITSFAEKAKVFNEYFLKECKTLINDSILPIYKQLVDIEFSIENLKNTIHALNPNKFHGPDYISIRMLRICGDPILVPLDQIFRNIIQTGIYPDQYLIKYDMKVYYLNLNKTEYLVKF